MQPVLERDYPHWISHLHAGISLNCGYELLMRCFVRAPAVGRRLQDAPTLADHKLVSTDYKPTKYIYAFSGSQHILVKKS